MTTIAAISVLLEYIVYDPASIVDSDIVSIFDDVLYDAYSDCLKRYARVKWANRNRSPAENAAGSASKGARGAVLECGYQWKF